MSRTQRPLLKIVLALSVIGLLGLIYLDARITTTFIDKMWELPAKVYARPLELFVGAQVSADDLAYELEALGYRKVRSAGQPGQVSRAGERFDIYPRVSRFPNSRHPPSEYP